MQEVIPWSVPRIFCLMRIVEKPFCFGDTGSIFVEIISVNKSMYSVMMDTNTRMTCISSVDMLMAMH